MAVTPLTLAKAEAFRIWVKSIIGEKPQLNVYEDYVEVDFTDEQRNKMITYLDKQVARTYRPSDEPPPDLQIRFGKVLVPWSIKYMAPAMLGIFALGYIANTATKKR